MDEINLDNIQQATIEELVLLPTKKLIELEQEASNSCIELKEIKAWISGIIVLRDAVNNTNYANDNKQQINYGGENEQVTDYIE